MMIFLAAVKITTLLVQIRLLICNNFNFFLIDSSIRAIDWLYHLMVDANLILQFY